ncbi:MAG: TIGR04388 family protein, partial [Leptospira sp.]|nr:TIGR04388 family protein [Leptospira sp.]
MVGRLLNLEKFWEWSKTTAFFSLVFFLSSILYPLTSIVAQSVPQLNNAKQFRSDELQPYVDQAKQSQNEADWWNLIGGGSATIEADWEAAVDAEISTVVNSELNSDVVNDVNAYRQALQADLELQKQSAKSEWVADMNAFIQDQLAVFLGTKSLEKNDAILIQKDSLIQAIDPTVQQVTTNPASLQDPASQVAQGYYDGKALWDSKWTDLQAKQ